MFEALRVSATSLLAYLPSTQAEDSVASVLATFFTAADRLDAIAERERAASITANEEAADLWLAAEEHEDEAERAVRSARFLRSVTEDA